jgi:spermidine synthase
MNSPRLACCWSRRLALVASLWACSGTDARPQDAALHAQVAPTTTPPAPTAAPVEGTAVEPLDNDGVILDGMFSRMHIQQADDLRSLYFIRDNGDYALQTRMLLSHPNRLQSPYTRAMFSSYLFRPQQDQVLIVGLGGGAMVRFLRHHDPALRIDAVEIDPVVVGVAADYFGTRPDDHTRIITQDAFVYLRQTTDLYDVIYMDAFLKPSADTDATGNPLRLRTLKFLRDLKGKLKPLGLVVFNLNRHDGLADDVATISEAFAQTYVFHPERTGNYIVVAATDTQRLTADDLTRVGKSVDARLKADYKVGDLVDRMIQ